ncbi:uncharacterized protein LOC135702592 [Ochlerotatus camptorhynchus]|uniref:uncharacterized protein LOC135702592 n=1 Tax=Ochlerotatus camptorhynchus TaxID=644619 RepID=UPI0031DC598B
MTSLSEGQDTTKVQVTRCISLLSQLNAKVDVLAVQKPPPAEPSNLIQLRKVTLTPVHCLDELESLEQNTSNEAFVESIVESLGSIHGKDRYFGDGWTVCLQIVDYFFDRQFLMGCSWTGTSRNKKNDDVIISKIAFHKYVKVIDLFYQVVIYSDPTFALTDCQRFLHRCLKNAKQRFEEIKGTRTSVARKHCKQIRNKPVVKMEIQDDVDTNPDVLFIDHGGEGEGEGEEDNYAVSQAEVIVEEYLLQELQ